MTRHRSIRFAATLASAIAFSLTGAALATEPTRGESLAPESLETVVARMAKIGSAWSPTFSPDGERLALVTDLSGVPQVWIVPVTGGWPQPVTTLEDQVGEVTWSPRQDLLAFSLAPGGGMNQQIYLVEPDGTGLRRLTDGGRDNNWLSGWSADGRFLGFASNRENPGSMDSYLYDFESGEPRRIAENRGVGTIADLGRDGRRAVVARTAHRGDNDLYLVDLGSGEETLLTPHEPPALFNGGKLSPDGRTLYLGSNDGRDLAAFARIRLAPGGEPGPIEVLAERPDAELQSFELDPARSLALLHWNVAGRSEVELYELATGERRSGPELPAEILAGAEFSPDGRRLALVVSGATAPMDVWVWDRVQDAIWQVTRSGHAGVELDALVRPELARYRAHDGVELSGWLYRPPGADGPAPYVLSFHGGPEAQERPRFRGLYQALLARGIGVFAPNVRGSSGFGKRFVNLDNGALRFDAIRDVESTVAFLVESGHAHPARLGIMGGSYGGYMTMAGLAWYPELFAAGANLFGVVNFATFFAHTEPWMAAVSTVEYGNPETEAELLRSLSPLERIDRVEDPTLVLHGQNDTNVPVIEAEQIVDSLEKRGVPVEYVLFPDEGHGFRKLENRVTAGVAIVEWFDEHLKKPAPTS